MKCECGGTLSPRRLKTFDLTPLAGLRCELRKVPGLRCGHCAYQTVTGEVIAFALDLLALAVAQLEPRLTKEPAVFLRKRLRLTQQELADRMGTTRATVGKWECGMEEISAAHDGILRFLVLGKLVGPRTAGKILETLATLDHVRTGPPRPPPPFVLERELRELRAG